MIKSNIEESTQLNIQYNQDGLAPAIVQEVNSGEILMLAWVNSEALEETLNSGYATFWSRSRQEIWKKGETSGNLMKIEAILVDCDQDAIIFKVIPLEGGACHTRNRENQFRKSCFYRKVEIKTSQLKHTEE